MSFIVAADTGGTFTDLAAYDRAAGRLVHTKSLTTYGDLVDGVMDCVRKAALDPAQFDLVKFGTTLVINTYIQRNGARIALVTTRGHKDVLDNRRGNRPNPFDLRYIPEPPLVERDMRFEVKERIGGHGETVRALDLAEIETLATKLRTLNVEAVAVSFINSYANPAHEEEATRILRDNLPGVFVTAGTELSREWYEFERTSTAVANAYVGPRLQGYVENLDSALRQRKFDKTFYLMASNGGVFSVERALRQPVMLVESGPVGGVIGAGVYAQAMNKPKIIAFDMGGTTAKCAVVQDGAFEVKSPYYVGGRVMGFPVQGAVLDIVEVGAGGGSIASLDAQGRLSVGPRSAGSTPGPVCYGRGGSDPTITDANVALGRIGTSAFLGGEMKLDENAARAALRYKIAIPMGYHGEEKLDDVAHGVLTLGSARMADAIRRITIERGLDPREFSLFAFGGGGPLHAAGLARELAIPEVIIPPEPGIFSALGMLLADARTDESLTFIRNFDEPAIAEMLAAFERIEARTREALAKEIGGARVVFERRTEMRFRGQRHAMRARLTGEVTMAGIRADFEKQYRQRYGFVTPNSPIEFIGLISSAFASIERPPLENFRPAKASGEGKAVGKRAVYFPEAGRVATPVFARSALPQGFTTQGPAVIEEYGSTTIVGPRDHLTVGAFGELTLHFD